MDVESAESFSEVLKLQGSAPDVADARLRVEFEEVEFEDESESRKEGRPIFKTGHVCTVTVPGDKDNVITFRADKMDRDQWRRFGKRYEEWKRTRTNRVDGTLLRECGGLMSRARAREWEALNVFTVEELSNLSDANIQNMRGATLERQKARDFISTAKGQAPLAQARAENEKLKAQVSGLEERLSAMEKLLEQKTDPGKKAR